MIVRLNYELSLTFSYTNLEIKDGVFDIYIDLIKKSIDH